MKRYMKVAISAAALLALLALAAPKVKALTLTYVQVLNALSQWVPTGSVFEPGLNPVMVANITSPINDNNEHAIYTVPEGKRLVVQHASATCQGAADFAVHTIEGAFNYTTWVTPPFFNFQFGGSSSTIFSAQITAYADPGTTVDVGFGALSGQKLNSCTATIAGYLVSLNPPAGLP